MSGNEGERGAALSGARGSGIGGSIGDRRHMTDEQPDEMLLYHGTSIRALPAILREGIIPIDRKHADKMRGFMAPSDVVHLGLSYRSAVHSYGTVVRHEALPVVIEVDTALLDFDRFMPDGDFLYGNYDPLMLFYAISKDEPFVKGKPGIQAILHNSEYWRLREWGEKAREDKWRGLWLESLFSYGCAYQGSVPAESIRRLIFPDPTQQDVLWQFLVKHAGCKATATPPLLKYGAHLFDTYSVTPDEINPDELSPPGIRLADMRPPREISEMPATIGMLKTAPTPASLDKIGAIIARSFCIP